MAEDASARLQPCRYDTSSFASSRAQAQFSLQAELTRYRLKPELRTKRPRAHQRQVWSSAFRPHWLGTG